MRTGEDWNYQRPVQIEHTAEAGANTRSTLFGSLFTSRLQFHRNYLILGLERTTTNFSFLPEAGYGFQELNYGLRLFKRWITLSTG